MRCSAAMVVDFGIAIVILASVGCDRPAPSTGTTGQSQAAAVRRSELQRNLPDRVAKPQVAESERAAPAPRILSAAPNVSEICCALGLREFLVGRTRYS